MTARIRWDRMGGPEVLGGGLAKSSGFPRVLVEESFWRLAGFWQA
jgi:hypothetical protein